MWIALRGEIGLRNPMQVENRHEEVLKVGVQRDPSIVDAGQEFVPRETCSAYHLEASHPLISQAH